MAEYKEGPKAKEDFEDAMKRLFRAPKDTQKQPPKPKKKPTSDKD